MDSGDLEGDRLGVGEQEEVGNCVKELRYKNKETNKFFWILNLGYWNFIKILLLML